jgi:hypothetical protein
MLNKLSSLCFFATLAITPAFCANINYTLTSGVDKITFSLPEVPTAQACNFSSNCFSLYPVGLTVDGTSIADGEVNFYTNANGGGLTIVNLTTDTLLVNNDGPGSPPEVLFTGTVSDPTLETFSNLQLVATGAYGPLYNEAFLLNGTSSGTGSTTPEPSSVILLLVGGFAIAGTRARGRLAK